MSIKDLCTKALALRQQLIAANHVVTPNLQKEAENLYSELKKSGENLNLGINKHRIINPAIAPRPVLISEGKYEPEPFSAYFSEPIRIKYLIDWILLILPITKAIEAGGPLPTDRDNNGYQAFINSMIDTYANELNNLPVEDVINKEDLQIFNSVCESLKSAVSHYFNGQPSNAYNVLSTALDQFDTYIPLDSISSTMATRARDMYKIRVGDELAYDKMAMFHIPFQLRGKAATNRYSIPGLPCLYLGSSPLICWEELGRPSKEMVHISLYIAKDTLNFLDFSVPPMVFTNRARELFETSYGPSQQNAEQLRELYNTMKLYALIWPLIALCSIRVKNKADHFKPEYIVPQILLQWVQQSNKYDGICYFSTKINNYNFQNIAHFRNYALPVKQSHTSAYCPELQNLFHDWTPGIPWSIFEIQKSTITDGGNGKGRAEIELVKGVPIYYHQTDFHKMESFLFSALYPER